jgi:hypothetical protein
MLAAQILLAVSLAESPIPLISMIVTQSEYEFSSKTTQLHRVKRACGIITPMTTRAAVAARGSIYLVAEFGHADRSVESELPILANGELRELATAYMRRERKTHTLLTPGFVHEACARLVDGPDMPWQSRPHFFAVASHHVTQTVAHHARKRNAAKRRGVQQQIILGDDLLGEKRNLANLPPLNLTFDHLDPRACLMLYFFVGLFEEMAVVIEVSMARPWLHNDLRKSP